jgi:ABC-type glycerol-3-phosphate transport system substrate-binding protein
MLKKVLGILTVLILVSLMLVACNADNGVENIVDNVVNDVVNDVVDDTEEEEEVVEEPMLDLNGTTISFWHVYGEGDPRNEAITAIVAEFNAANEYGITVEALDQGRYSDVEDKVNAGIQSGDLPNVVQAYTSALLNWDTVDMVVDLEPFVTDANYGLTAEESADIYPSIFSLGVTPEGRRLSWPLSQSANVLVYNYTWAQELGFDAAPTSPEELKAQLCAASEANATDDDPDNDGTGGIVWNPSTSNITTFAYAFGASFLNADETAYEFATDEWKAAALYINDLRDGGCTFETESYPNPEQAQRKALVTLSSTAGLKYYGYAFADEANEDVWGFFPAPGPSGLTGVDSFTQAVGVLRATPEQEAASWLFISYLTSAANQATWIEASGYFPTHFSTETMLADYIAGDPVYAAGYAAVAQLAQSEPETFPAWNSVRRALGDAAAEMYAAESAEEIDAILAALNVTAAELVAEISD